MTDRPPLDRGLADRMHARAVASERRYRHLTELARHHGVDLPPMEIGDERAIDAAVARLEQAGARIDWDLVEIPFANPTPKQHPTKG